MIVKQLRYWAILAILVTLFVLLIPSDPKNAILLGYSRSRLAMLAGFALPAGLSLAALYALRNRPGWYNRLEGAFTRTLDRLARRQHFAAGLAFLVLIGLLHLEEWLFTSADFQKALLLRALPFSLLVVGLAGQAFSLPQLRPVRKRWIAVIALVFLGMLASKLLQNSLLRTIERPFFYDESLVLLSQIAAMLAAFFLISRLSSRSRLERTTWGTITVLILVLFLIQWFTYPDKYWRSLRNLALAGPAIVFAVSLLVLHIFDFRERIGQAGRRRMKLLLQAGAIAALLLLAVPFVRTSALHSRVLNYSAEFVDQKEYLVFARTARLENFNTTGDHNRVPLYPFFLSLFDRPGLSETGFFELGKTINIWLSLALLALLFFFVRKYLSLLTTALYIALAAFSLYIFKAAYIQAESLYYFFALIGFVLAIRLLVQPGLRLAIAVGVSLGLAQVTKASVLPGLLLLAGLYGFKELLAAARLLRSGPASWDRMRPTLTRLGILAVALACFLAVIFPYIHAIKQRFGHYFYNVNTTFYVWYDTAVEAKEAEAEHHFAERWPAHLSADELPGPVKYLREHTLTQILDRFTAGLQSQVDNLRNQFSVTNYQLSYLAILGIVFLADLRRSFRLLRDNRYAVVYSILYFVGYLAAFAWYSPIAPERRFTYGLYLPFLFAVFISLRKLSEHAAERQPGEIRVDVPRLAEAAHVIVCLTLVVNIYFVLVERMLFDRYGS